MANKICKKCAMDIPAAAEICPYCNTRLKTSMATKAIASVFALFFAGLFISQCINPSVPPQSAQAENPFIDISRTLVAKNITGCGDMEWYPVPNQRHEYKVKCSDDGTNWRFYTVWTKTNEILPADSY